MGKQNGKHEQYTLRVRRGSEVDKLLGLSTGDDFHSRDEIVKVGGFASRSYQMVTSWLPNWFDNVSYDTDDTGNARVHYQDIKPEPQAITIQKAEFTGETSAPVAKPKPAEDLEFGQLIWPDMPPIMERDPDFREPAFYKTMKQMVNLGEHVSLAGPPGIGKSTSVEQLAAEQGKPLVNIGADNGLRRRDLVGSTEMVNGTTAFVVGEFAAAVVNGWWVKIDEVNGADPDALLFVNGCIAPPYVINIRGKAYPVSPDFRLFVTYNPGLVGTKPLPPSFKDRFFPVKLAFPTESQLRRMLEARGMPTDATWTTTVLQYAASLWQAHVSGQIRYQISPRRLIQAVRIMNAGETDIKSALRDTVVAMIDSDIEARVASSLLQYL